MKRELRELLKGYQLKAGSAGLQRAHLTPFLPENHLEMITEWQGFHPVFHR